MKHDTQRTRVSTFLRPSISLIWYGCAAIENSVENWGSPIRVPREIYVILPIVPHFDSSNQTQNLNYPSFKCKQIFERYWYNEIKLTYLPITTICPKPIESSDRCDVSFLQKLKRLTPSRNLSVNQNPTLHLYMNIPQAARRIIFPSNQHSFRIMQK